MLITDKALKALLIATTGDPSFTPSRCIEIVNFLSEKKVEISEKDIFDLCDFGI